MKCQFFPFFGVLFALAFAPGLTSLHAAGKTALDTATIEAITGLKGVSNQTEGTFKISKPRNDVAITVEQVRMAPFMGLTSWATFAPGMKDRVMVMGDMVRPRKSAELGRRGQSGYRHAALGSKPVKVEALAKTNKHPYALDYS